MGHLSAGGGAPRPARNPAVAICEPGPRMGRQRIRGADRGGIAPRAGTGASERYLLDYRRARRARRPFADHDKVYQGGGAPLAVTAGEEAACPWLASHLQVAIGAIAMDSYEKIYREFRWDTPEHFNFGDVIDHYAADPNRVALLWEDQDGNRARLTFADIKAQSNRIANVLTGLGLKRGDPVLLVLPRISLWQAAYIGALKAGAMVIPCTAMLREKDLTYRANHSGAKAIIASVES